MFVCLSVCLFVCLFIILSSYKNFCRKLQLPKKFLVVRVSRNKRVSAQFRAKRTRSIIEFANTVYCTHMIFIGMIRIHVFCKHPSKLEIKSDGDISDGAFYRTS